MRLFSSLLLASLSVSTVLAADKPPSCDLNNKCPEDKPCCSQYGQCGTGAYCLGGCDPRSSHSLDSCAPEPICKSKKYTWDNLDNAAKNDKYLGDASKYDWMYSGDPKLEDGNLILTMPPKSGGSLFANNTTFAFILLSDVKDEIDYEFVGSDLTEVQTNYYWQGVLDYNNGGKSKVDGEDTFGDWHTYELDWTPDSVEWKIDGEVKRTLKKSETFNATSNQYQFPQTPSRLQMSLWPAGQASNAKGTIEWAGGEIDWDSEDIQKEGYYFATIGEVTVECYDPPTGANVNGDKSYIYTDSAATNDTVEITDKNTVLSSFGATGTNMTVSSSTSAQSPTSTSTGKSDTVPEVNGGSGNEPGNSNGSGSSGSGSDGGSGGSDGDSDSFSQGGDDSDNNNGDGKNAAASPSERVLKGSFSAVLVAIVVLMTM
ncbi:Cell wall [Aspergillus sclerotialis]|uniref:Cell wall n=1 Tax=Aspergillus sclerotialis TaxID=2070753 RepID=A0A3A2Z3X1_9EURO|nr:Cell wall [Aspergillus sclerotialis]